MLKMQAICQEPCSLPIFKTLLVPSLISINLILPQPQKTTHVLCLNKFAYSRHFCEWNYIIYGFCIVLLLLSKSIFNLHTLIQASLFGMYMHGMCVCICTRVWKLEADIGCLPQPLSTLLTETMSLPKNLQIHLV